METEFKCYDGITRPLPVGTLFLEHEDDNLMVVTAEGARYLTDAESELLDAEVCVPHTILTVDCVFE